MYDVYVCRHQHARLGGSRRILLLPGNFLESRCSEITSQAILGLINSGAPEIAVYLCIYSCVSFHHSNANRLHTRSVSMNKLA